MKIVLRTVLSCFLIVGMATCGSRNKNSNTEESSQEVNTEMSSDDNGAAKYFNIFNGGKYHLKAKMVGNGKATDMEMYLNDKNMATIIEMEGLKMKNITKDSKMYMVNDAAKTVMITKIPQSSSENVSIKTEGMTLTDSGTAEFNGKMLPYKEYSNINQEGFKTQYFLDGDKLAGIRNIIPEMTMDIIVIELDENVPDSVFDIPSNYQKMEF